MECAVFVGLPAAGKTTFYRERLSTTHEHVSKDTMRNVRRPGKRQEEMIANALARGRSVVVDNTNASVEARAPILEVARAHNAHLTAYYFPSEAADALRRNRNRRRSSRVPDVAIFVAQKQLTAPSFSEGFDRIFIVRMREKEQQFDVVEVLP